MTQGQTTPCGEWVSPITSSVLVEDTVGLGAPTFDGGTMYWTEARAREGGRIVLVRCGASGARTDVTPAGFNVRTRVHEYGGGAYTVRDGIVYFTNFKDQRVYRQDARGTPEPITPAGGMRYADLTPAPGGKRLAAVREAHGADGTEAVNTLVLLDPESENSGTVLVEGFDFYSSPRFSPDGRQLAWLAWNHPNMPWDATELWVADFSIDGSVSNPAQVAGGETESIFQPEWSPDGVLHFVSDRSGWWNLYRLPGGTAEALHPMEAEFGRPQWVFDAPTYGFESASKILCLYQQNGRTRLARLDTATSNFDNLPNEYADMAAIRVSRGKALFFGGHAAREYELVLLNLTSEKCEVIQRSSKLAISPAMISTAEAIEFPTAKGLTAHAYFYPPKNAGHAAPQDERPPLLVLIHGGPTSATTSTLRATIQYWTSRGFAVADVNYGGSTGYGREYRRRLNGQWGVVDVEDCVNAAKYLAGRGLVDPGRMAIRGGSAGGFTTLAALATSDVFSAGASHYGVCDLEVLARDTHKFESRYLDSLIGPYPEAIDIYKKRSPIHSVDSFSCPIIFFQGMDDKVVPPNQSQLMFDAVRDKGIPTALVLFEGEGHGFRKAENIRHAIDTELCFYGRVFGFTPAGGLKGVPIENM